MTCRIDFDCRSTRLVKFLVSAQWNYGWFYQMIKVKFLTDEWWSGQPFIFSLFIWLGWFFFFLKDLRRFYFIAVISRLESRRYQISEIVVGKRAKSLHFRCSLNFSEKKDDNKIRSISIVENKIEKCQTNIHLTQGRVTIVSSSISIVKIIIEICQSWNGHLSGTRTDNSCYLISWLFSLTNSKNELCACSKSMVQEIIMVQPCNFALLLRGFIEN